MPPPPAVSYRPGRETDLDACTRIWRVGIEDYQAPLNQPPMPEDLAPLRRLLTHLLATDPERFWVACQDGDEASIIGFGSASLREGLWFLAMLFVDPAAQADGVGQALMDRTQAGRDTDPGGPAVPSPDAPLDSGIHTWGMCTDAVQPISNGLYAKRGMVPRIPIWRLFGEVRRWSAVPPLPAGLVAVPFERIEHEGPTASDALPRPWTHSTASCWGRPMPVDHAYLRREGRVGFLAREAGGRTLGYVYGSGVGRLGPVAAIEPGLLPALIGTAIRETPALGSVAVWVPGTAAGAMRALLDAGLRIDGFPGMICWSRPDHPFERYLPISLALV